MWQQILALVAKVTGPIVRTNLAGVVTGEVAFAVDTTAAYMVLPDWLKGCYVEITAVTANVDVLTGVSSSAATPTFDQASSFDGSRNLTVNAATGRRVLAGTTRTFFIPKDATHFGWDADGAGRLHIARTSNKVE